MMTTSTDQLSKPLPSLTDYGLLLCLALIWGASFVMTEFGLRSMSPATLTFVRLALAAMILWSIAIWKKEQFPTKPRDLVIIFLAGLFGNSIPFVLISWGQQDADANIAAILMGIMPLMTIFIAHFLTSDEKFKTNQIIGVLCGFVGLIVLIGPASLLVLGNDTIHQLAIALAATSYALNAVLVKLLIHVPRHIFVAINLTVATLSVALFADWTSLYNLPMTSAVILPPVLLGIFPTALASIIMFIVITRQGANFFGQINLLVPVSGVIWAFIILDEKPAANAAIALVIILSGIVIARGAKKRSASNSDQRTPAKPAP